MRIFVVRRGDSLYSIAKKFGVKADELAYINGLSDPSRLSVGQTLVIPGQNSPQGEIEVNGYAYPGMTSACPTESLSGELSSFAAFIASTLTPNILAIEYSVSPRRTIKILIPSPLVMV